MEKMEIKVRRSRDGRDMADGGVGGDRNGISRSFIGVLIIYGYNYYNIFNH